MDPAPGSLVGTFSAHDPTARVRRTSLLCLSALLCALTFPASAQPIPMSGEFNPSAGHAFGWSLLVPGLGHRYVNQGQWTGWAKTYAAADAALWLSLLGGEWRHDQLVQSYTTLARGSANALVDGKDRTFFLTLASFESSDEYRETMLRNRNWDRIDYVDDPAFHWEWETQADFNRYRDLRDDAESLRRRRSILIASLVANRLISGAIAARSAGRSRRAQLSASLTPPIYATPGLALNVRF